ncbi:Fat storage-inducing transmembrane protein 2, partial [Nibea albiflora]
RVRQNFHWIFLLVSVVGSVLKDLDFVPQTYFSRQQEPPETCGLGLDVGPSDLPFLLLFYNFSFNRGVLVRRLLSLVVATAVWYACTETFSYIEEVTGSCFESDNHRTLSRASSRPKPAAGAPACTGTGLDISGHSFILSLLRPLHRGGDGAHGHSEGRPASPRFPPGRVSNLL